MRSNSLTGALPLDWTAANNLVLLYLQDNQFTGAALFQMDADLSATEPSWGLLASLPLTGSSPGV